MFTVLNLRQLKSFLGEHIDQFDHEAILGSAKEAEEFDHLSPEEAKRRLGILLKKMDLTGDGFIDRNELKAWIIRSFRMLSEEEAMEKLEDADEDHDGRISWSEYLSDTYGVDSDDDESLQFHEENLHVSSVLVVTSLWAKLFFFKLIGEDKEMWDAADKNQDGILDVKEFQVFSNPEEYPEMIPLILNQTLKNKDLDKDGSISFQVRLTCPVIVRL